MNNAIRLVRNTGTDLMFEDVMITGNYIEQNRTLLSWALQVAEGGKPNFLGPVVFDHNFLGARKNGGYITLSTKKAVWDNNMDSVTQALIAAPASTMVSNTPSPGTSAIPNLILNGYQ